MGRDNPRESVDMCAKHYRCLAPTSVMRVSVLAVARAACFDTAAIGTRRILGTRSLLHHTPRRSPWQRNFNHLRIHSAYGSGHLVPS